MQGDDAEYRTNIDSSAGRWLLQALRSVLLLKPDLAGLRAAPWGVLLLMVAVLGGGLLLQRGFIPGPAQFYWQAVGAGWGASLLTLWACWLAARSGANRGETASLFVLVLLQEVLIAWPVWGLYLAVQRLAGPTGWQEILAGPQLTWLVAGWVALSGAVLLLRHAGGAARAVVVLAFSAAVACHLYLPRPYFWYPEPTEVSQDSGEEEARRLHLTQETLEAQSAVVVSSLHALQPQRPGVIDLYAITFAPHQGEEVFRRESTLVSELMRSRFGAEGHTVSLLNHADTSAELPWATALNLRRAIERAASLMDREEDILFIHLTSHGARDGNLSMAFEPLVLAPVTPQLLRTWLDEAGVRYRVISVSACYSGSWLAPLADPGTLTMTAADATHTSYGCGHGSELTYFGRAMYAEQLRETRSFEQAHAAAREVIRRREQEAGKTDGYSNPQIQVGEAIRARLAAFNGQLDAAGR